MYLVSNSWFDLQFLMEKLNAVSVNRLVSFERAAQIAKMTKEEKLVFNSEVKKQAAYLMLSVSRAVESKDYKTAKSILIYIADSCSCIQDPDSEVRYLIEVCCQHLALVAEMETMAREKNLQSKSEFISSFTEKRPFYVFRYNKFSGEFQCDEEDKSRINQSVLFYMSKLNSILFNYQNNQNQHSIVAMLKIYYPSFLMVAILIAVLFLIVFVGIVELLLKVEDSTTVSSLPIIICCLLFIIPLLKIYNTEPIKKDSIFFQKKLGQQILRINQICAQKGEGIKFFMPEGIEINVQVFEGSK